jgi:hypothetical protein
VDFSDSPPFSGVQITAWSHLSHFQSLVAQRLCRIPARKTDHAGIPGTSSEVGDDFRSYAFMREVEFFGLHLAPAAFAFAFPPFAAVTSKLPSPIFSTPSSCGMALVSSPLKKHCTY